MFQTLVQAPPGQPALPGPLLTSHGIFAREAKPDPAQSRCLTWALLSPLLLAGHWEEPEGAGKSDSELQEPRNGEEPAGPRAASRQGRPMARGLTDPCLFLSLSPGPGGAFLPSLPDCPLCPAGGPGACRPGAAWSVRGMSSAPPEEKSYLQNLRFPKQPRTLFLLVLGLI